jgi:hypothetical protein
MNPAFAALLFPRDRQERGADPGPFVDHRSYKPHLRERFHRKCVYCRTSDGIKGSEGFGVDHYLPRSSYPDLLVVWFNLFYACNVCNTWKGEAVSTPELYLPNPCEHRMADHLQYEALGIETYTRHGEWMAELLHLDERCDFREFVLSALGRFLIARVEILRDLTLYEALLEDSPKEKDRSLLQEAVRDTAAELERIDRQIERLTGEPISR